MTTFRILFCSLLLASTAVTQSGARKVPEDLSALRSSAERGDAKSQWELGSRYDRGLGVAKDSGEAMKWYCKAAEQGDAARQYQVGSMSSFAGDYVQAAKWYRKAAEQGILDAHLVLGNLYVEGKGVTQDYAKAAKWYRKAAENTAVDTSQAFMKGSAQIQLGHFYEQGTGVPQDYVEAVKWYRKAADGGDPFAVLPLYSMCIFGHSTKEDCTDVFGRLLVFSNLDISALSDIQKATLDGVYGELGELYLWGKGVPQNNVEAAKWLRKAAERGNLASQVELGFLYADGKGVPQDLVLAYMWFNLAAASSNGPAQKDNANLRDQIAARMTPAQIAEAQRLAREWKPIETGASNPPSCETKQLSDGTTAEVCSRGDANCPALAEQTLKSPSSKWRGCGKPASIIKSRRYVVGVAVAEVYISIVPTYSDSDKIDMTVTIDQPDGASIEKKLSDVPIIIRDGIPVASVYIPGIPKYPAGVPVIEAKEKGGEREALHSFK